MKDRPNHIRSDQRKDISDHIRSDQRKDISDQVRPDQIRSGQIPQKNSRPFGSGDLRKRVLYQLLDTKNLAFFSLEKKSRTNSSWTWRFELATNYNPCPADDALRTTIHVINRCT